MPLASFRRRAPPGDEGTWLNCHVIAASDLTEGAGRFGQRLATRTQVVDMEVSRVPGDGELIPGSDRVCFHSLPFWASSIDRGEERRFPVTGVGLLSARWWPTELPV